jgi:hypothetical protein
LFLTIKTELRGEAIEHALVLGKDESREDVRKIMLQAH